MAMSAGSGKGPKSEINVTPLVDVVLVLLIIFMVVTPMLQRGKDVELPKAGKTEGNGGAQSDPLIISLTSDRKVYIEQDAYEETAFEEALRLRLERSPGKSVLLKGDQSLSVGDVRRVMDLARRAGAPGVSLAVQEEQRAAK